MKLLSYFRSLTSKFFRRSQVENETDDELRSHVDHRADDLERTGLDRAEAERRARIEFGGHMRFKEDSHKAMGGNYIETFIMDARFSLRVLRKSPGFTIAAILTLALGIGANAMVFSVTNAFLLRAVSVPRPDSLFAVWRPNVNAANESYLDYIDLRDRNRSFDDLVGFNVAQSGLDTGANPTRVWIYETSGNYFDALSIQPFLGRFFHSSDEQGANSAPYIVLTYTYWQNHFQGDHNVVGRIVQVNKHPFTILGVAPPEFNGTMVFFGPDFFVPIVNQEQVEGVNNLDTRKIRPVFMVMGHLKTGVTHTQAIEDLNSIGSYLEKNYPEDDSNMKFTLAPPGLYGDRLGRPIKAFLSALMLLAALILIAACANLGSLFAARAADRGREIALRLALGASRSRILRQLFTEAILISLIGGAVGILGSIALLRGLAAWQPFPRFPMHVPVNPDANVYVVALVLTLISGFIFGALPVRQILRTNTYEVIKPGSTGRHSRRITVRDLLLVGQIAICAVLVTSSMVAVRGLVRSLHSNFGFEMNGAMLAETDLAMGGYSGDQIPAMQKRMIEAAEAIPGLQSVGLIDEPPLGAGQKASLVFTDRTADLRPGNAAANAITYKVSPKYFHAARTVRLTGRDITWHDDKDAPAVAVVNQEFARRIFGNVTDAMNGYFKQRDGTRVQVVGIVEDGKYQSLTEDPQPVMFLSILQSPSSETFLVVRSIRDPQELAPELRRALQGLDNSLPFITETWDKELDIAFFAPRMATMSLGVMGVMGAMLAVTGVFGMEAYSVSRRMKELGIRIALGAQRGEVLRAALGRPFKLMAFGSAAGLILGILASRVLASIVYLATPRDPFVLAGVVIAMASLGLLATWIPARRALSVDPLTLLREE